MSKYYYTKEKKFAKKKVLRITSIGIFSVGVLTMVYVFFPFISYQVYFAPSIASETFAAPIPKITLVNSQTITTLFTSATRSLNVDYLNAGNWYPSYKVETKNKKGAYLLSIPKLHVKNAIVSTADQDLNTHLVHFNPTNMPPAAGNAVIFGHSTLPQLFDASNYKTIFSYLYKLTPGDDIFITINGAMFTYKIVNAVVVEPEDTSILIQSYDASYITLVTCTPPGTVWKRLALKAKLEEI